MANRLFNQFSFGLEKMRVSLFLSFSIDGSGNPVLDAANSKGIESITKLGAAGKYRITMQDAYVKLLMVEQLPVNPVSAAVLMSLDNDDVQNKIIDIQFASLVTGAGTYLSSGESRKMVLVLRNSTAP
jgi:hypothetical protein